MIVYVLRFVPIHFNDELTALLLERNDKLKAWLKHIIFFFCLSVSFQNPDRF